MGPIVVARARHNVNRSVRSWQLVETIAFCKLQNRSFVGIFMQSDAHHLVHMSPSVLVGTKACIRRINVYST